MEKFHYWNIKVQFYKNAIIGLVLACECLYVATVHSNDPNLTNYIEGQNNIRYLVKAWCE